MTAVLELETRSVSRSSALDKLRGLAVLLMVCDHVAVVLELGGPWRHSVTRAAMPLFFVLGGHLARRYSWRWAGLLAVGFGLELVAPWAGPFELLWGFVLGAFSVVVFRRWPVMLWLCVLLSLTLGANGYADVTSTGGYHPQSLFGLMAAGALIGRELLERLGAPLPALLERLGRYPLSVYAGHLVILEGVRLWLS